MPIFPIKDISEYTRMKNVLKDRYEMEKTGDQVLYEDQTKLFKPVIDVQKEVGKYITESNSNALVPLRNELRIQNAISLQAIEQQLQEDTRSDDDDDGAIIQIDFDRNLDDTDRDNLSVLELDLPSIVFDNGNIDETLDKIKKINRTNGQILGNTAAGKKATPREKEIAESQKQTLKLYKEKIESLRSSTKQFVSTPKKSGRGIIHYSDPNELCKKLTLLYSAKQAGNNGEDDNINDILDELLKIGYIDKDYYDQLYNKIFSCMINEKGLCKTCNCLVRYSDKARHMKTIKHLKNA